MGTAIPRVHSECKFLEPIQYKLIINNLLASKFILHWTLKKQSSSGQVENSDFSKTRISWIFSLSWIFFFPTFPHPTFRNIICFRLFKCCLTQIMRKLGFSSASDIFGKVCGIEKSLPHVCVNDNSPCTVCPCSRIN